MSDLTYSIAAVRSQKITALKERKASLEASSSSLRTRSSSLTLLAPSESAKFAHQTSVERASNEKRLESATSVLDPEPGGSKVQQYIANLEKSAPPPRLVSSSSDSEDDTKQSRTAPFKTGGAEPFSKARVTGGFSAHTTSDDSEGSSSDDSGGGEATLKKYKNYLKDDNGAKQNGKKSGEPGNITERKDSDKSYDEYRRMLSKDSSSGDKSWASPKKKLGAPPSLQYSYKKKEAPRQEDKKRDAETEEAKSTLSSRSKPGKFELQSKKIAKDDLGILASMLGDGDDSDGDNDEASRGVFSLSSVEDGQFVDNQSSDDGNSLEEEVALEVTKSRAAASNANSANLEMENREKSTALHDSSSQEEKQLHDITKHEEKQENGSTVGKTSNKQPETSRTGVSAKLARLQQLKKSQHQQDSSLKSSVSSDIDGTTTAMETNFGRYRDHSSPTSPSSEQKQQKTKVVKPSLEMENILSPENTDISENSSQVEEDSFSAVWDQESDRSMSGRSTKNISGLSEVESAQIVRDVSKLVDNSSSGSESSNDSLDFDNLAGMEQYTMQKSASLSSVEDKRPSQPPTDRKKTLAATPVGTANSNRSEKESEEATKRGGMHEIPGRQRQGGDENQDHPISPSSKSSNRSSNLPPNAKESPRPKGDQQATTLKSWQISPSQPNGGRPILPLSNQSPTASSQGPPKLPLSDDSEGSSSEGTDQSLDMFNLEATPVTKTTPSLNVDDDGEGSIGDFSLDPADDIQLEQSDSEINKPEYQPQRDGNNVSMPAIDSMNQGFQELDTDSLVDIEAPMARNGGENDDQRRHSSSESTLKRPPLKRNSPLFLSGVNKYFGGAWIAVLLLGAIGLPVYFFVFADGSTDKEIASLDIFPTPPTLAPTVRPIPGPSAAPMINSPSRTREPTSPPATVTPTAPPTCSRPCQLRNLLLSKLPSSQGSLIGFDTPQYNALDWLVNNPRYDDFSEEKLVQRFALATVFFSTGGDNWRVNDLWLSDEDECAWFSGSTDATCNLSGSFIRLNLDLNDLSGTIPPEIALLSNLQELDLSKSGSEATLSGDIPTELGLLQKLKSLNLSGNALSSTFPTELGKCAQLESLDLTRTKLGGSIPPDIAGMINLQVVNISSNRLNGTIPSSIGALSGIQKLDLHGNALGGALPIEIGELSLLTAIDMEGNRVTSIPDELGNLVLLNEISFANNRLEGTIPRSFGNLIELQSLELQGNRLTGTIPSTLGNLVELRHTLDFSNNVLSGSIPSELGRLTSLRKMFLNSNSLTGGIPETFSAFERMGVMRLESNNLEGSVSESVCSLFSQTFPLFASDCAEPEIECTCCMYCCADGGECTCQFIGTELEFLCADFP